MKNVYLLCCFLFLSQAVAAQQKALSIGLETGGALFLCPTVDKPYIRKDMVYSASGDYNPSITSHYNMAFGGMKLELKSSNEKWKFGSGLRFIQTSSDISKANEPDYFYFLYRQDASTIDYLKVKRLSQTTNYLGVPLDVKFFPFPRMKTFKIYFTAGTQLGYKLSSKTSVVFPDPNMNPYTSEVQSIVEKPNNFIATVHGGAGFEFNKLSWPIVSLGLIFPSIFLSNHTQLTNPVTGVGFQLSIQLPLKKMK